MRIFIFLLLCIGSKLTSGQFLLTTFEKSKGKETTTYADCIDFYQRLDKVSTKITIKKTGLSDAGYPYHLILYSNDGKFDPARWHHEHKIVILIINGIHPGEPDGIDASMLLLRDLSTGKIRIPENIALAVIPIYNIGGALNRNSFSRVNQDGPASYGFRGNAQNLDLNRDFTKNDSRNSKSFVEIFHWIDPDIQLDNHVSDGADHQYTMTLLSTQWNKLGGESGRFIHDIFDPALYMAMNKKGWPMCPYVNFEEGDTEKGWEAFYDAPRYSSGYAALFHTISYMSETHMLKPFSDRVRATYALMQSIIEQSSIHAKEIIEKKKHDIDADLQKAEFALSWKSDGSKYDSIFFKGYTASYKLSDITGQQRLFYDRRKPFEKSVRVYNYFSAGQWVAAPKAYLVPQGWYEIIDRLKNNGVQMHRLLRDSLIDVETYHIDAYNSAPEAYEKHHRNTATKISTSLQPIQFLKGDYIINTDQPAKRFLIEMLEPAGDDSYFSWNFLDAILQEKEYYNDYRWEDVAIDYLKEHPELKTELEERKKTDTAFAHDAPAQLNFIYKNSPYYENAHLRYPIYRLNN
ncbi:MAG: hypothetical protein JST75_15530 [Bacteroidetes bacterium]|nr:hypothetical protein [Bacteroidota bacterium]